MQIDGRLFISTEPAANRVVDQEGFREVLERGGQPFTIVLARPEYLVFLEELRENQIPEAGRWLERDGVSTFEPIRIALLQKARPPLIVDWHRLLVVFYSADSLRDVYLTDGLRIGSPAGRIDWMPPAALETRFTPALSEMLEVMIDPIVLVAVDSKTSPETRARLLERVQAAGDATVYVVTAEARRRDRTAVYLRVSDD